MKRLGLLLVFLTGACTSEQDRLTDEQAMRDPAPTGQVVAADRPRGASLPNLDLPSGPGEVVYKALGTEPGWALTVRENAMLYQGDYGTVRIVEATPPRFSPASGTTRTGRLTVSINRGPCSDGMSDQVWRDKVTVAVSGGRTVRGCGGGLIQVNAVEDRLWTITAVNGTLVNPQSFWLQFQGGRVSGRFGCNVFGAGYSRNGDHLALTSGLEVDAMGCSPNVTQLDQAGRRILASSLRIEQVNGRTRLVSEAGTIDLAPAAQEDPTA